MGLKTNWTSIIKLPEKSTTTLLRATNNSYYGRGRAGQKIAVWTTDGRTKDEVPYFVWIFIYFFVSHVWLGSTSLRSLFSSKKTVERCQLFFFFFNVNFKLTFLKKFLSWFWLETCQVWRKRKKLLLEEINQFIIYMSPVFLVFHTIVTWDWSQR